MTKSYHSEVNKDNYVISENITKSKCKMINDIISVNNIKNNTQIPENKNIPFIFTAVKDKISVQYEIKNNDYYLTDGIFCSFNCIKAFIKDLINIIHYIMIQIFYLLNYLMIL